MKMVMYPPVEQQRLEKMRAAVPQLEAIGAQAEEDAVRAIADADAFFGKLTPPMLAAAGKLRWVQTPTASLEHYIFPELAEHPAQLTNMRGLFSDVIADHVFAYILVFARRLNVYFRQQLEHRYEPLGGEEERTNFLAGPHCVTGMDRAHMHLSDGTAGIVGLGAIGSEIARRAAAFGMRVLAVDPVRTEKPAEVDWLGEPGRLPELLDESDFVIIAAPHTPDTERMFRREQFRQMRPGAYLINIGRGAIVVLDDLVAALRAGEIAGAALDVFESEPLPADHPLWDFPNVIITPHVAACSVHVAERHLEVLLENLRRFADGEPLLNVVNKEKWF